MKSNVTVTANENGEVVIVNSNKPEYAYIRLESSHTSLENGFMNTQKRSALISGKTADLKGAGFTKGQILGGSIIAKEQLAPFYVGQEAKINPSTKATVTVGGQPVYRQTFYTEDASAVDSLLVSDSATVAAGKSNVKLTA